MLMQFVYWLFSLFTDAVPSAHVVFTIAAALAALLVMGVVMGMMALAIRADRKRMRLTRNSRLLTQALDANMRLKRLEKPVLDLINPCLRKFARAVFRRDMILYEVQTWVLRDGEVELNIATIDGDKKRRLTIPMAIFDGDDPVAYVTEQVLKGNDVDAPVPVSVAA